MDKLKNLFTKLNQDPHLQQPKTVPKNPAHIKPSPYHIAWPPRLTCSPKVLGEVTDLSNRRFPRDIGRSIQLAGHTYYIFGDTFCFDSCDEFRGVTNNTIALIPDLSNPTKSQYLSNKHRIPEFVPLSKEEKKYCDDHEKRGENKRYVNWVFGGLIERPGSDRREGWVFYDTVEIHGATPVHQCGIGVAKARVTDLSTGAIECERVGSFPLFDPSGPAWGNMSNIAAQDGWTYMLTNRELDNYMARIRTEDDFSNAQNYQFLRKGGEWVTSYCAPYGPFGELAHDVLAGQGQGSILYIPDFAPKGRPYLWVGCDKFLSSRLFVGAAPRPEGPWDVHDLGEMPKINGDQSKTRYCIFAHEWSIRGEEGGGIRVLVSWSDDGTMGGKVGIGWFTFAV
ncbi:hypothetical protein B0J11DRAFT_487764 [Dendryphion nanum]|uniref:Uncharacterized protein n=1 Tax=Dendryphion nanum TaxID=256645 RepID=A0A9P9DR75_9PLEO|nr:hypothetical protein B0J11DRAFT_487764 [Dendryphion nanum]